MHWAREFELGFRLNSATGSAASVTELNHKLAAALRKHREQQSDTLQLPLCRDEFENATRFLFRTLASNKSLSAEAFSRLFASLAKMDDTSRQAFLDVSNTQRETNKTASR